MTRYVYSATQTFTTNAYNLVAGDSLIVTSGANLIGQSTGTPMVLATGATIQNYGVATNSYDLIWLVDSVLVNIENLTTDGSNDSYVVTGLFNSSGAEPTLTPSAILG